MTLPRNLHLALAFGLFYVAVQGLRLAGALGPYFMIILNRGLIFVILATSLNLINGVSGQFSLGHMGFAAVGAYVSGTLTTLLLPQPQGGLAAAAIFLGSLMCGALAAALAGLCIGFPCLRLRGDYLAVVTLGFGEIIRTVLNAIPAVGGPRGLLGIPGQSGFTVICLATFLTLTVLRNLIQSPHGRAMLAIRENELAAEFAGVDTVRHKVLAFVAGALFAGLAGGLLAHLLQMAHPSQFGFMGTAILLVMVYAGGIGSLTGSALAALLLTFFTEGLRVGLDGLREAADLAIGTEWIMVAYALSLVLVMIFRTEGLMGSRESRILMPPEEP